MVSGFREDGNLPQLHPHSLRVGLPDHALVLFFECVRSCAVHRRKRQIILPRKPEPFRLNFWDASPDMLLDDLHDPRVRTERLRDLCSHDCVIDAV